MDNYYTIAEYKEDDIISREGEVSEYLYYIENGNATSYIGYKDGEGFLVEILGPGRFSGETGFLVGGKNTVTIVANCDLTVRVIHKDYFKQYLASNPNTGIELMHHMAKGNLALTKHIGIVSDELINLVETMEAEKPVPVDLKNKLLQYKLWK